MRQGWEEKNIKALITNYFDETAANNVSHVKWGKWCQKVISSVVIQNAEYNQSLDMSFVNSNVDNIRWEIE